MGELTMILGGEGLLKPRHYPVVVAMIDDFLAYVQPHATNLDPIEQKLLDESREIRRELAAGRIYLPLDKSNYPGWKGSTGTNHRHQIPNFSNRRRALVMSLFDGYRPGAARKDPMPAPNPGMVWGGDDDGSQP
jgi:hypothetical protein